MQTRLLRQTGILLLVGFALVILGYFYIDRISAQFFNGIHLGRLSPWLIGITHVALAIRFVAPVVLLAVIIYTCLKGRWTITRKNLFLMSLNVVLVTLWILGLKWCFGRYWPATWCNNLSWLQNHAYGFRFFQTSGAYQSFPSGHTAAIFSLMSVVWLAYPKWRWLCVIACLAVMGSLWVLNYHFFSDILAGAFFASLCGLYVFELRKFLKD